MGHGQRGVLPGGGAHQRRHQNRPGCARDEEQRVAQALDDCGRGQLGRHHEAGRSKAASSRCSSTVQHTLASRQYTGRRPVQRQHGARALSQRAAGIAEAGPECRDGAPAQPGFIEQHGQGSPALRWWRRPAGRPARGCGARRRARSGEEVKLLLRSGKARRARALTLPCREDRQCSFCGRSSPISRQPAGMVTHSDIRRGRKIIWRNRRKSPKNVSVTTPNRRPAQFCVGVHVQCVSDRARTARPRIRTLQERRHDAESTGSLRSGCG